MGLKIEVREIHMANQPRDGRSCRFAPSSQAGGADDPDSVPPAVQRYGWRCDFFRPNLAHLVNLTGRPRLAGGRRWAFAVDDKTADIDQPEIPDQTSRCPDCRIWAASHGYGDSGAGWPS
ncbi:hypothetical protein AOZ06_13170 [Kibdelosporangium phytohabitans]|uniref:Uncharacterized protein n=1 Tax=Kibdelosporangium phytohabitans TaxID=860235 RepID=A0A0N9HRZ3_9PSEU|nr:hypothetical protein AOZ06_12850 [Kibdelosporangium phytohabitans]ALG07734.1 hypothetical protein AOZ06_13170 [Kibdelosporangium phytohabitans]